MNILITAPSLDTKKNVSGISSVVNNILNTTDLKYIHFEVGKQDNEKRNFKWLLKQFYLPINLFKVLLKNKIDIFHLNAPLNKLSVFRDLTLLLVAKLFRKKTILHFHGGEFLIKIPKNKFLLIFLKTYFRLGNKIITLSEYEREIISKNYNIKLENIYPLENCVVPIDKIIKKKQSKVRIIFLGRIVESKGINEIIDAMKKLFDLRKDFQFFLYGTGPLQNKINAELGNYMQECFSFKGIVFGEEKEKALLDSDIFILPSLHGEGLPIALLEAMNFQNICIVTNDGSMGTVIKNNINGFVINKHSTSDLLSKIIDAIELIKNDNFELQNRAKLDIVKNYNCIDYSKKLKNLYKEL